MAEFFVLCRAPDLPRFYLAAPFSGGNQTADRRMTALHPKADVGLIGC
jgi:hypothetical protein